MKVFILGHRGMLGHVVARYLQDRGFEVISSERRYEGTPRDPLIEEVRFSQASWVINAIGRIKQRSTDFTELLRINSLFPLQLASRLLPQQRLLHASTDCVFSGQSGSYPLMHERDATDDYGFSKILGEEAIQGVNSYIFRVSIVGPELSQGHGLLGWFFRQNGRINGYVNHRWNGITTLEWAKHAASLISGSWKPPRTIVQFASSPSVSKYELLSAAAAVWEHRIEIVPFSTAESVDRTLIGDVTCAPIALQLNELRHWHDAAFK